MTVYELIQMLVQYPADSKIFVMASEANKIFDTIAIEVNNDTSIPEIYLKGVW